ncbi:permease prefix domain 1-containing protein [Alicyclobacillus dauci]|uniref:Permease prefix domain 1-containing protein n=1 Tax=Alicyclobacillus dauci TaxID=1475485 RepID=A0ABY6Z2V5_9BACL|nr:permease prefix domain 1-containing protein [Alicyclobacillus dauci]WAH37172.1 permease prefix domain 1-containing protein [Alicyclobacillus dauci]
MTSSVLLDRDMKRRVHIAVDRICNKISEPQNVVSDLREELTANILASIQELVHNGHSIETAVELAIQHFGEPSTVLPEIRGLVRIQRVFAKWLLAVTLIIGGLGAFCITFNSIVNSRIEPYYNRQITTAIEKMANQENIQSSIPLTFENNVKSLVDKTPYVTGVGMSVLKANTPPNKTPFQFVYPNSLKQIETNGIFLRMMNNRLFTNLAPTLALYCPIKGTTDRILYVEIVGTHSSYEFGILGVCLLSVYWALFSAWGIINAIYNRRFNIWWGISMIMFNLLGYFAYELFNRKSRRFVSG